MQMGPSGWQTLRSYRRDPNGTTRSLAPGTRRRILTFAQPYARLIGTFLVLVVFDAFLTVLSPLLLKRIVDDGVTPGRRDVVVVLALIIAGVAVVDTAVRPRSDQGGSGRGLSGAGAAGSRGGF